MMKCVTVQNVL